MIAFLPIQLWRLDGEKYLLNIRSRGVFQDFFNVTVYRHLMGYQIDENLLMKLWES